MPQAPPPTRRRQTPYSIATHRWSSIHGWPMIHPGSPLVNGACESAGKVTPGRCSKGPPFPAGRSGCKPTRALSQPCHLMGAERQRFKRRQPACGVCAVTSNGRVARAGGAGQAVRVPGEADRLPQSRPNPRGGSTLSSAERSSVHISSSLCAVADSPETVGEVVEPCLILILEVKQSERPVTPNRSTGRRPAPQPRAHTDQ